MTWDKHKQLCNQPLKQIKRLAYQGQVSSRIGAISIWYLQQVLGTLLNKVESENASADTVQLVKDIFCYFNEILRSDGTFRSIPSYDS